MALSFALMNVAFGAIPLSGTLASPIPQDDHLAESLDAGTVPSSPSRDASPVGVSDHDTLGNYNDYSGGDLFTPFYRVPAKASNNFAAGSPSLSQPSATAPASSPAISQGDSFAKDKAWVIGTIIGVVVALIIGICVIKLLSVYSKRERSSCSKGSSSSPYSRPLSRSTRIRSASFLQLFRPNRAKAKSNISIIVSPPSYNTSTLLITDGFIYGPDREKSKVYDEYSNFEEIDLLDDSHHADTPTSASSPCQSPATPVSIDVDLGIRTACDSCSDINSFPTRSEDFSFTAQSKKRPSTIKSIATTRLKTSPSSFYSVDGTLSDFSSTYGPESMIDQCKAREALLHALTTPAPVQHGRTKSEPAGEKVPTLDESPSDDATLNVVVAYNRSRLAKARSLGAAL